MNEVHDGAFHLFGGVQIFLVPLLNIPRALSRKENSERFDCWGTRRKLREGRKFQKQLQAAKSEEKQKMKLARLEVAKKVRKQRNDLGSSQDFDKDYELEMQKTEKELQKKTSGMNLSKGFWSKLCRQE